MATDPSMKGIFTRSPLALALAFAASGPVGAESLSVNSMTLDGGSGRVLGNIARQSPMASFHQVQKEMVFTTLKHLGINIDELPSKVRTDLEKPQTTNPQAFLSFSMALDKADKGLFAQASVLLKQAAKLDPGFALAKGMARLMPANDLAPGADKQVILEMKKEVKEDAKKTADDLTKNQSETERNLNLKSANRQGEDSTEKKLNTLASGEEVNKDNNTNTEQKLNRLGLSDQGESAKFESGSGNAQTETQGQTNTRIETQNETQNENQAATGDNTRVDSLSLADSLSETTDNGTPSGTSSGTSSGTGQTSTEDTTTDTTTASANANQDAQREEVATSNNVNGIFGAFVGGQFVSGTTALDLDKTASAPKTHSFVLAREGNDSVTLEYSVGTDDVTGTLATSASATLWGASGPFLGLSSKEGEKAFLASLSGSTTGASSSPTLLFAVAGTPTTADRLPASDRQSVSVQGLMSDIHDASGVHVFQSDALVDWGTGKVLGLKAINLDNPVLLGRINRTTSQLEVEVKDTVSPFSNESGHYVSIGQLDLQLYGAEPAIAAGLFSMQRYDIQNLAVGTPEAGIAIASDIAPYSNGTRTPDSGETWQGRAVGMAYSAGNLSVTNGTSAFTFLPSSGTVTGGIGLGSNGFTTATGDANAFFSTHEFAARKDNSLGTPSFFSTQGDFTGTGWTDTQYSSLGYWAHDHLNGASTVSILDGSTWVAGLLTSSTAIPALGWADYTGKALGSLGESGGSTTTLDLITGDFSLRTDFNLRKVRGTLNNLRRNSNNGLWLQQADFATTYSGASGYQATLTASGIDSGNSSLTGDFYGPAATETGGSWIITKSATAVASGVYTGKRGNVDTTTPSGMADPLSGLYGALLGNQFIGGSAQFDVNQEQATPSVHRFSLQRDGDADVSLVYNVATDGVTGTLTTLASLWSDTGSYSGTSRQAGTDDAYYAEVLQSGGRRVLVVAGTPTASGNVPVSGVQTMVIDGVMSDGVNASNSVHGTGYVDWGNAKAFLPMALKPRNGWPLILGAVNRAEAALELVARQQDDHYALTDYAIHGTTSGLDLQLYGSTPAVAGALFSYQTYNAANQPTGPVDQGILIAHDFTAAGSASYQPAAGAIWQGQAMGIRFDLGALSASTQTGTASFTFNPATASVTGEIHAGSESFSTTSSDANAFITPHAFGAQTTNALGHPSYFSTQGDYTGAGWTDARYSSMGYWAHDYAGSSTYAFVNHSTWVAGQPTSGSAMPLQGWTAYSGKVLGVEHSGPTSGVGDHAFNLLSGDFALHADFGRRLVTGNLGNLDSGQTIPLLPAQVNFNGTFTGATGYQAQLYGDDRSGAAIDSANSYLSGAFYGPHAEETGGVWRIANLTSPARWAAGVFSGLGGGASPAATAIWAGSIGGEFMVDLADVARNDRSGAQSPADVVFSLHRTGNVDSTVTFRSNNGSTTDFSYYGDDLWGHTAGSGNGSATVHPDAYLMHFSHAPASSGTGSVLLTFGGNRTTSSQLPASGQYSYHTDTLTHTLSDGHDNTSSNQFAVDFSTNKAFTPVRVKPAEMASPVLIGVLDRSNAVIDIQAASRSLSTSTGDWGWYVGSGMSVELFGAGSNVMGGLVNIQGQTATASAPYSQGAMIGHTDGFGLYASLRTVVEGEQWNGYSSSLALNKSNNHYASGNGVASFVLQPASGTVTGAIGDSVVVNSTFNSTSTDTNAYLATDGFGAIRTNTSGLAPFYYSTRSTYTDWETLPGAALYAYLDKLSYHYTGAWSADSSAFSLLPVSNWVAGLSAGGHMPASGQIQYAGYASGLLLNADTTGFDHVSGLFGMTADFANRSLNGKIGNLTPESASTALSASGFGFSGTWSSGSDTYASATFNPLGTNVNSAGVAGSFYGNASAPANETGGAWWMDMGSGEKLFGIYSGLNRNAMAWSAGVLAGIGAAGSFAAASPLVAYAEPYTDSADKPHIKATFAAPGAIGQFTTGDITSAPLILNHTYKQWTLSGPNEQFMFEGTASTYQSADFRTANSYIQFSAEQDFFRYVLSTTGNEFVEGYYGQRSTATPTSGASVYNFHQSSLNGGQRFRAAATGMDGQYYGTLYVNWTTGQVYGLNLDAGLQQRGVGIFLGRVNATDSRIEGSHIMKTNRLAQSDTTGAPRFVTDVGGFTLDLFGSASLPSGVGGVFSTEWQSENLTLQPSTGQSLISGMLDRASLTTAYQPAQNEIWNGHAVAYVSDRTTGILRTLGSADTSNVSIKFRPTTGNGHVWANIQAGVDLQTQSTDANPAALSIQSDSDAPSEAMNVSGNVGTNLSAYVNPKAFAMAQESSGTTGTSPTPDFVAAAPEAYGTSEAARYDYTTWGYWGTDYGVNKDQTVAPISLWVAGKLTSTVDMPTTGTAQYTGIAAGLVTGSQNGYVQGQLAMNVDFSARSVGGSINNLNLNNNTSTPWLPQANLSGAWSAGSVQYSATASGAGITAGSINGAFYGPQAAETGGRWGIAKNDGSVGTGIFVGKR